MAEAAHEPVAVVGMAALFPGAGDLTSFWRNIVDGVDAITEAPASRLDPSYYEPGAWSSPSSDRIYCRRGGFVDELATFDPARFGVMPVVVDGAEPDQFLALRVAADAIADAGGVDKLPDRRRVGVIIGRGAAPTPGVTRFGQRIRTAQQLVTSLRELVPTLDEAQLAGIRSAFQAQLGVAHPEAAIGLVPNLAASRIANRLDLQGPAYTIDAACASSLLAVDQAVLELAAGRCDAVLAGGVHHCHDITFWSVFCQLRALSPTGRIRPFDRAADGVLLGEGTGIVVLKRLSDARRDDDRVYAVIRGTGVASDGRASSLMSPRVDGQVLAVRRAWQAAGLDPIEPDAVGLVEGHGTATNAGDAAELATLAAVFGTEGTPIGLGSVKSMIGHAQAAAGIAGFIKATLAVHHGVLPPTLHCSEPHAALTGTRFEPAGVARAWERGSAPRRAGVNAFGFGGIDAHVVLAEVDQPVRRARPTGAVPAAEPMLLLAGTAAEILHALETGDRERRDGGPCRLAVVAPNARRLELARRVVAQGRPWRGRNDVWFTPSPLLANGGGKVAFLFPGREPGEPPNVDDVANHFGLERPSLLDGTAHRHGLDVIGAGELLAAALHKLDIAPDLVAGHSLGEWTAAIVAGLYPRKVVDGWIAGFDPDAVELPPVVFAALGCGADQAAAAVEGVERVVVSHDNCPHQSVVCGDEAGVALVLDRLRADGVLGELLPFHSGFHSPWIEPYLDEFRRMFPEGATQPPVVPVWSATTVAPYPVEPGAVRALSFAHLVEPVRFRELVERLHDEGVRAYVQVGAGSLAGFVEDTLRGRDHLAISAGTAQQTGLQQLRRVAAALWAEGRQPLFDALDTGPAPAGPLVRLDLGTPLVHLDVEPIVVPAAAPGPRDHPVLAAFEEVLSEATRGARQILDAWTPAATRRTVTWTLSATSMPWLADHCVTRQPDGWPVLADRHPVVPMTALLELMADAARELVPGATVVGLSDVQALRLLEVAEPVTARIDMELVEPATVRVVIDRYAHGTVHLADAFPPAPAPSAEPLRAERPCEVSARQLYDDHWMFHGRRFQVVSRLDTLAENGIRGVVTAHDAPGATLDAVGQITGFWLMVTATADKLSLPARVAGVRLFGPAPPPGARISCTAWIRAVTDTALVADVELSTGDGRVWARVDGFEQRRFNTDELLWPVIHHPEHSCLAEEQPGGWCLVRERTRDAASRDLVARRYLGTAELAAYFQRRPRVRRPWLLGRIAVKDAVRRHRWALGAGPIFPVEVATRNDDAGRPVVDTDLAVSLAHTDRLAVAIARPRGTAVGIDIEKVAQRDPGTEALALTDAERDRLDEHNDPAERTEWFTRFWTAKEAVAKAEGTGLRGRPTAFHIETFDGDLLSVRTAADRRYRVATRLVDGHVVAWTPPDDGEVVDGT